MKSRIILLALNDLDERHIRDTAVYSPEPMRNSPERIARMNKKRIVTLALAAALILALGVTVCAASGFVSIGTHAMPQTGEYTELSALPRVEKIVGYPLTVPESFSDGYVFSRLLVRGEAVYGEDAAVEKEFYAVHADYSMPGAPDRWLDIEPYLGPETTEPSERRTVGGVEVRFSLDHYKVVPESYEKTTEDLEREAAGHFYLSFGSNRIEEYDFAFASFVLDGVNYCLTDTTGSPGSLDALAQAALDLITAAR